MAINIQDSFAVAGATFSISAELPATDDEAGYVALTFTPVGQLIDIPTAPSKQFVIIPSNPIDKRRTQKSKGSYDIPDAALVANMKADDVGQILFDTAAESDANHSIELVLNDNPGGITQTIIYCQALIGSNVITLGTIDNIVTKVFNIAYNSDPVVADAT